MRYPLTNVLIYGKEPKWPVRKKIGQNWHSKTTLAGLHTIYKKGRRRWEKLNSLYFGPMCVFVKNTRYIFGCAYAQPMMIDWYWFCVRWMKLWVDNKRKPWAYITNSYETRNHVVGSETTDINILVMPQTNNK